MCTSNMKIVFFLLVLLGLCFFSDALALGRHESHEKRNYFGYKVLRLHPSNSEQLRLLHDLAEDENSKLDFWLSPSSVSRPVDVMIPPERFHQIEHFFTANDIQHQVLLEDVDKAIENEKTPAKYSEVLESASNGFFTKYQRINDIHNYLEKLAVENSAIASVLSIGKSYEGRDLKAIKISKETSNDKPIIWIDAGIHAREWISTATAMYIAKELIQNYNTDSDVKSLVDTFEWYILPSVNPDGYEYSHDYDRMWRKTRSESSSMWGCKGVDANRNFGFKWNQGGASNNPCSEIYAGPEAFSEPETKAISEFILARKNQVKLYIATHSYSQLWLTPWGWTSKLPDDYNDQYDLAKVAVNALVSVHGTKYKIGSSTNLLYIATGGADDWAYGAAGIKYSYTPELRDTGRYGFILPASHIIPSGEETFAAIKAITLVLKNDKLRDLL